MSTKLIAGAAAVVLLGTAMSAGLAQAQDRDRGPRGGGEGGPARAAPAERAAPQQSAPRVERSQPRAERAPERRAVERPQRVERQREQNVQRAERRQRDQQQRVERNQREQSQRAARQQREQTQRAERQQREQTQRAERQQREQKQNAERQQREQQQKSAEQRRNDQGKQAERNQSGPQRVNQLQATNEQRKGVRDRIFRERGVDRISKRDFRERVAVGVRIDRRHHRHLHRLTPAILAFAPIYAGYSYLVVDDEICIVDPATYYVVDVIPSTVEFAGRSSRPQLVLSAEDMRFIYASVPKDRPVDVRIRLALGAEIPGRVDLERFPGGVIDRVPQVDGYRYIVVEDDVVIVDPNDRAVALVITE
jgi:Protein of unknown function (DUF1236)